MHADGTPLVELAVAKGMISRMLAERIQHEATATGTDPFHRLVAEGHLHEHAAQVLKREWDDQSVMPLTIGQYRIVSRLGSGSMGTVYKAKQPSLGDRLVAIKVLSPLLTRDARFVERFHREARSLALVSDPHVVQVMDIGRDGDLLFMVMEYVAGGDAERLRLQKGGRLSAERTAGIIHDAALGLAAIHRQKLIHRDLKPLNILLTRDGVAKIADLGLSRPQATDEQVMTEPGLILGTPAFMAPEQALGQRNLDIRTDLYALGATAYTLVSGRIPYHDAVAQTGSTSSARSPLSRVVQGPFPDPRAEVPDLPEALVAVIRKATAVERHQRYQTPEEMAEALAVFLDGLAEQPSRTVVVSSAIRTAQPSPQNAGVDTVLPDSTSPAAAAGRKLRPWAWAVTGVVVLGTMAWTWWPSVEAGRSSAVEAQPRATPAMPPAQPPIEPTGVHITPAPDPEAHRQAAAALLAGIATANDEPALAALRTRIDDFGQQSPAPAKELRERLEESWQQQRTALDHERERTAAEQDRLAAERDALAKTQAAAQRRIQARAALVSHLRDALGLADPTTADGLLSAHPELAQDPELIPLLNERRIRQQRDQLAALEQALDHGLEQGDLDETKTAADQLATLGLPSNWTAISTGRAHRLEQRIRTELARLDPATAQGWIQVGILLHWIPQPHPQWDAWIRDARKAATVVQSLQRIDPASGDPERLEQALSTWPTRYDLRGYPLPRQAQARLLAQRLRSLVEPRPVRLRITHDRDHHTSAGVVEQSDGSTVPLAAKPWGRNGALLDPAPARAALEAELADLCAAWETRDQTLEPLRLQLRELDREQRYPESAAESAQHRP